MSSHVSLDPSPPFPHEPTRSVLLEPVLDEPELVGREGGIHELFSKIQGNLVGEPCTRRAAEAAGTSMSVCDGQGHVVTAALLGAPGDRILVLEASSEMRGTNDGTTRQLPS